MSRVPTLSVSARASTPLHLAAIARVARGSGLRLTSVDIGTGVAKLLFDRLGRVNAPISSVWIGDPWQGVGSSPQHRRRVRNWINRVAPALVAFDLERQGDGLLKASALIPRIEQTRQLVGRERRLLIALRGRHFAGGRQHLAELTALRHLAEEWDVGFALDLASGLDPAWEAEAAIIRLGGHVRLMRVSTSATHRLAVGQSRVAARAVAAALELANPPEIALVPAVPLVLQLSERARIGATVEAASVITTRAARVTTQRASFLNQDLWPRLRG